MTRPRIDSKRRKPIGDQPIEKVRMPDKEKLEMLAVCTKLLGGDQIRAHCADDIERNCRIPGKLKKKIWIKENDLIIIKLWDFQPIKADVIWRFKTHYAKDFFIRKGI